MNTTALKFGSLTETRDWLQYLLRHSGPFFDEDGVMLGAINVRTLEPFTAEWASTQTQAKLPEPAAVDYVAAVSYEDSWDAMGEYLEYVRARYEVTGEDALIEEMRRIARLAIDVYREDNPDEDSVGDWMADKGIFRRLYAGRYGQWPYPEPAGPDQMNPLMFGLLNVREYLETNTQQEMDAMLIGSLGWFMRRNFAYVYRGTVNHSIEVGPLALSYYIPALAWAHKVTGEAKYLKAYNRLHEDYLYNPDYYLSDYKMPYIESLPAPEDDCLWLRNALRWTNWVAWLSVNAPNANYYQYLFKNFAKWNTRLLKNTLPSGLGHDYDNMAPTTRRYPEEWIDEPYEADGAIGHDGMDGYAPLMRARMPALRRAREHTYYALLNPDEIDLAPIEQVLRQCDTPDHFTYWYDPEDKIVPSHMNHRSWSMQSQFVTSWLTAYWRLRKIGLIEEDDMPVGDIS